MNPSSFRHEKEKQINICLTKMMNNTFCNLWLIVLENGLTMNAIKTATIFSSTAKTEKMCQ